MHLCHSGVNTDHASGFTGTGSRFYPVPNTGSEHRIMDVSQSIEK